MPPRRRGGGDRQGLRKGPWLPEEDEVLQQHVQEHGEHDWSSIQSKGLLNRPGKSCRLRWVNKLRPGLTKGKFSEEEERVVLDLQAKYGNKWAMIATHLHGRTDNDVKNFWSTRLKRLARLSQERPQRKRSVRQSGGGSTPSAVSHEPCAQRGSSFSMITFQASTYDANQSNFQEPDDVKHCIDAPLPRVICLPAPDELPVHVAMETGSSSIVPFGTYAENSVPGAGADLALLDYAISQAGSTSSTLSHELGVPREHSSSMITFQASIYDVGQSSIQEPHEVKRCTDAPLPEVLCLPATVDATMESGSSSVVLFGNNTENQVPGAGADLGSLHYAAFIEPLAVVPAPLSFGSAPFYDDFPNIEPQPMQVIPPDPSFLDHEYFAAVLRKDASGVRFDDLTPEVLDFFVQS